LTWENSIAVRARVNGVLTEVAHLPLDLMDKISMRFKVMAKPGDLPGGHCHRMARSPRDRELDGVQLRHINFSYNPGRENTSCGSSIRAIAGLI